MKTYITGNLLKLDTPNANGRIYPSAMVEKCVKDANNRISRRDLFSEVLPLTRTTYTDLNQVGGVVTELYIEDMYLKSTVELINTHSTLRLTDMLEHHKLPVMLSFKCELKGLLTDGEEPILHVISVDVLGYNFTDENQIARVWTK